MIPRQLSIEYSALESARGHLVQLDKKQDFIGNQALIDWQARSSKEIGLHKFGAELEIEILGVCLKQR